MVGLQGDVIGSDRRAGRTSVAAGAFCADLSYSVRKGKVCLQLAYNDPTTLDWSL
jgi:hypothetical protein